MNNFNVGDCVLFPSGNKKIKGNLGKIESLSFHPIANREIAKYTRFLFPEELPRGRQEYNSMNEVYKTSDIKSDFTDNIIERCTIIPYETYLKNNVLSNSRPENNYFFRQSYHEWDGSFTPDVDITCYCNKIFDPDNDYSQCRKCKEYFHLKCFFDSKQEKCFNEICGNLIKKQLIEVDFKKEINEQLKKVENKEMELLGKKRDNKHLNDFDKATTSIQSNRNPNSKPEKTKDSIWCSVLFKSLPQSNYENVLANFTEIEKEFSLNESISYKIQKDFCTILLYTIEEIKATKKTNSLNIRNKTISSNTDIISLCKWLSSDIEMHLHSKYTSNKYKKQVKMLWSSLHLEKNDQLRYKLITGEITPSQFVSMTPDELAPPEQLKEKIERENKNFKENVLIEDPENMQLYFNNPNLLSIEPKDKNSEWYNPWLILTNNTATVKAGNITVNSMGWPTSNVLEHNKPMENTLQKYKNLPEKTIAMLNNLNNYTCENLKKKLDSFVESYLRDISQKQLKQWKLSIK